MGAVCVEASAGSHCGPPAHSALPFFCVPLWALIARPAPPAMQVTYNPNYEDLPQYMPAWSFDGALYQAAYTEVRGPSYQQCPQPAGRTQ